MKIRAMKILPAFGLAISAVALSAMPAGAATSGVVKLTSPAVISHLAPAALPNSNIKKNTTSGMDVFAPTKLSAAWSASSTEECTATLVEATITNKTSANQTLTYQGTAIGIIKKHKAAGLCFFGTGSHKFTFGLTGSTSKLKITAS